MRAISVLMRDHYNNKIHPMDPHLLDIAHNLQSRVGSHGVFEFVCGYRSPETNAMMHEASAGVAAHSMHIEGKAMDIRLPGVRLGSVRRTAVALGRWAASVITPRTISSTSTPAPCASGRANLAYRTRSCAIRFGAEPPARRAR